jgi:hypothetical protein
MVVDFIVVQIERQNEEVVSLDVGRGSTLHCCFW